MRKLIVALLVTSFALPAVNGEGTTPRGRMVAVPSSPKPVEKAPAPAPEKPSFFKRFFGPLPTPTPIPRPTPAAAATPAPGTTVKRRPRPKAKPEATGETPDVATPKTPADPEVKAPVTPTVKAPAKTSSKSKTVAAPVLTGEDNPIKFRAAKVVAMEDPAIKDLKSKADGEVNEAESQKAVAAYNRALFRKIREIDPSVSEYADKVEQSMNKRIGAEKGKE